MQCLFEWDFQGQDSARTDEVVEYIKGEFAPDFDDDGYIAKQVKDIVDNVKKIDALIFQFAPEWPLAEMTNTDRNILRLGTYELRFDENIPAKVAINEAIELGKAFGGDASGKFVNGVLGAIFRDMVAKGELKEIDKETSSDPTSGSKPKKRGAKRREAREESGRSGKVVDGSKEVEEVSSSVDEQEVTKEEV